MRYVVVVRSPEESVRVHGTYSDYDRAQAFAEKINAEVERREDAEFADWQAKDNAGQMPDGYGRAGVLIVHEPRYREALAFALTGNSDPALARKRAI